MTSYQLVIYVDSKLLQAAPPATLGNLCLVKTVNSSMNVVFQSRSENGQPGDPIITQRNVLRWTEEYKVQAVESFASGVMVQGSTTARPISFGQSCTYSSGDLSTATTSADAPANGFAIKKLLAPLTGAVLQKTGDRFQYIFVDPAVLEGGQIETFIPKNNFLVFFDRELRTSYMFSQSVSTSYAFSFGGSASETIKYIRWGYANPDQPRSASEEPVWSDYGTTDPFPNGLEAESNTISACPPTIYAALPFSPQRNSVVNGMTSESISTVRKALYGASHSGYPPSYECNLEFKDTAGGLTAEQKGKLVAQYLGISMPPGFRIHFSRIARNVTFDVTWKAHTPAYDVIKWSDDQGQPAMILIQLLGAINDTYKQSKFTITDPYPSSANDNLARRPKQKTVG